MTPTLACLHGKYLWVVAGMLLLGVAVAQKPPWAKEMLKGVPSAWKGHLFFHGTLATSGEDGPPKGRVADAWPTPKLKGPGTRVPAGASHGT